MMEKAKKATPKKSSKQSVKMSAGNLRVPKIIEKLYDLYPEPECALHHETPFQLLIATVLSAQCTDVRVNMVTPSLFKKYPSPEAMAKAPIKDLENLVKTTGFYRNKAKNIKAASEALVEKHHGEVPRSIEELIHLPGVGRKTANVVLGNAFGITSGIVVDTHVGRLSRRIGLTKSGNPEIIERDLEKIVPREEWINFSHLLILHGRSICIARKPKCDRCIINSLCPKIGVTVDR